MKKIFESYNYAFGYIKGYFVLCGFVGIGFLGVGAYSLLTGEMKGLSKEATIGTALGIIIVILIAALLVALTLKKCPEEKRNPIKLVFWMSMAGLLIGFKIGWWFFKLLMKLIFHVNIGTTTSNSDFRFANGYIRADDLSESTYYSLYNATYGANPNAYISHGTDSIYVRVHNYNDGTLIDDAGNLYIPYQ